MSDSECNKQNPFFAGIHLGHAMLTCDAESRLRLVKASTDAAWLQRVVGLEGVQKTVLQAAERRLKTLDKAARAVRQAAGGMS